MKLKNCLIISKEEMLKEKYLFLFFGLILTLIFSISVSLMDVGFFLPERVAETIRKNNLDVISVSGFNTPHELESFFGSRNIPVSILKCQANCVPDFSDKNLTGNVLFSEYSSEDEYTFAGECQNIINTSFFDSMQIIISDTIADQNNLHIGDTVKINNYNGSAINVKVACIFEKLYESADYYISEKVMSECLKSNPDTYPVFFFYTVKLRDIFKTENILSNSDLYYSMVDEMLDTIRMLYITLLFVNMILILCISGIVWNMLNIYFEKRKKFYAVNFAIGMSEKSMLKIVFGITEILFLGVSLLSLLFSSLLINALKSRADNLFSFSENAQYIPASSLTINLILIHLFIFIMVFRFRSSLRKSTISEIIRYE